ncbi:MAG TPA: hypothetical protein V6D28_09405 [Leptolyngbyaceae cyanobacterium]
MNLVFLKKIPFAPLSLLCLAYALLGWYLSAHHLFWLVGAFIVAVTLTIAWKNLIWLENLEKSTFLTWLVALMVSLSIALIATHWILLSGLIILLLATTSLANIEIHLAGFSKQDKFWILIISVVLGLVIGEIIDIAVLPSIRF